MYYFLLVHVNSVHVCTVHVTPKMYKATKVPIIIIFIFCDYFFVGTAEGKVLMQALLQTWPDVSIVMVMD